MISAAGALNVDTSGVIYESHCLAGVMVAGVVKVSGVPNAVYPDPVFHCTDAVYVVLVEVSV